jgi:hypothetical protein
MGAATRVIGLVALGSVVALGSPVAATAPPRSATSPALAVSTATVTSVSFTVDLQARIPAQRRAHLLVQGQMDFVHHTLVATVTVPLMTLPASTSNAEATPDDETPDDARPAARSITLHTEWLNQHAYMSVPSEWTALANDAHTLSLPTSPSLRRMVTTALTQSAVALTYAKLLLDELTDHHTAHRVGSRTIGGVPAMGSKVDLTLAQLLKLVPELSPTMTKAATRLADQTIPSTVWVDRQGRLVEVDLAQSKGATAWVTGTMRFSHYGAPAVAPMLPAATVKPIPRALQQLLGQWYYF